MLSMEDVYAAAARLAGRRVVVMLADGTAAVGRLDTLTATTVGVVWRDGGAEDFPFSEVAGIARADTTAAPIRWERT